jgi:2-haloacid dehalogenase
LINSKSNNYLYLERLKMPGSDILTNPPKALTFDVFGTVVNWRDTVINKLISNASAKSKTSPFENVRKRLAQLTDKDWAQFAQEWRNSYKVYTKGYDPDKDEWRSIDTHHHIALVDLLEKWELQDMYSEAEIQTLSLIWHFLDPWKDTSAGMHKLNTKFITSSLSNGNQSLLKDLNEHGDIGFQRLISSADFKAYKPHSKVYLGAASKLGLEPSEIAMVAAHLNDLAGARKHGFRTIYVERRQEEDWNQDSQEHRDARTWVDLWISQEEEGFIEVARRFGIC